MNALVRYCYLLAALVVLVHLLTRGAPAGDGVSASAAAIGSSAFLLLGRVLAGWQRRALQRRRDARAEAILAQLLAAPDAPVPPFAVYLRPFSVTGRLSVVNRRFRGLPFMRAYYAHEAEMEFERVLAAALAPALPLVALGRPGEAIGAGRIAVSDAVWKAMFQRLIGAARWIVMIPSDQGETRWEVQQLVAQDLLGKTVFIMPPALKRGGIDVAAYWRQVRGGLSADGVCLPDYTSAGQVFRLGRGGRFYRSRYLPRLGASSLRRSLSGVVS
ncbi:hypothetical protein [Denitromonas sp.]|uniref:hypothetical protein n=1 Tax=Denitromonas sp. TaxID=2734609 RepID=UPI002AFF293A|nr:hypothetical protein [Denitromonas sp.]